MRRFGTRLNRSGAMLALVMLGGCIEPPPTDVPGAEAGPGEAEPAAALLHTAHPVTGLYEVGEVRAFEFHQGGQPIGRSWSRYEGKTRDDHHRFVTRVELRPPKGEPLRSASEIIVDEQGHLVSGFERSVAAELRYEVAGDTLTLEAFTGLPIKEQDEMSFARGAAHVGYMATIHQEMMLATRDLPAGKSEWRLVFLSTGRPHAWEGWTEKDGEGRGLLIKSNLGESIEFVDERIERVRVADDNLEVVAIAAPAWPTWEVESPRVLKYEPPADASFEVRPMELAGRAGEPRLAGEVLVPKGLVNGETRPAVLFLGGGSPADRHGFAGPPAVDLGFHEITDALAQTGFVVMRYDERGLGESGAAELSWSGQREDARRAFRMLLVQPEVDPDRIVIVGHGEGGWRAMQLAAERPKEIIGVALLGSPGRGYRKLFAGQPGLIESIETGKGLPPNLLQNLRWYQEILDVQPAKLVAEVDCPIWIAHGDKDFEVNPKTEPQALGRAAKRHKKVHDVVHFPELDHLFKREPGTSSMTSYLADRRVDSRFLAQLINWVDARGKRASSSSKVKAKKKPAVKKK